MVLLAALVQELLHNKMQSAASRTRMLHMIRSSATCLLNTIDTTLSHNGGSAGGAAGQHSRRTHKVGFIKQKQAAQRHASVGQKQVPAPACSHHVMGLYSLRVCGKPICCASCCTACLQVYLWRVCESVLRLTRPMVKDNVRLINCISRDMPPVKGDSTRLMQVGVAAAPCLHMQSFVCVHVARAGSMHLGPCYATVLGHLPASCCHSQCRRKVCGCRSIILQCCGACTAFLTAHGHVTPHIPAGAAQPCVYLPEVYACW
jgi:hypothetical protein